MSSLVCSSRNVVASIVCSAWLLLSVGCCASSAWMCNHHGKAHYQCGRYALARDEFRRAVIDQPCNPHYRHNLAMALKKTGDYGGAEQMLRANLEQASAMHQPTYHSLAQLLAEQGRQGEAQDLLHAWSETQPYLPESHVELAWIERESGNLPAAEQSLRRALRVNPRHPTAMAQLGQVYQDSGQPDRAAAMYQRSLATRWAQPQVQSRLQMLARDHRRSQARSALMMNPVNTPPTYAYGRSPTLASAGVPIISTQPPSGANPLMAAAPSLGPTPDPQISSSSAPGIAESAGPAFEAPVVVGPVLTPNADPAHTQTELTSDLPMIEPY